MNVKLPVVKGVRRQVNPRVDRWYTPNRPEKQ